MLILIAARLPAFGVVVVEIVVVAVIAVAVVVAVAVTVVVGAMVRVVVVFIDRLAVSTDMGVENMWVCIP